MSVRIYVICQEYLMKLVTTVLLAETRFAESLTSSNIAQIEWMKQVPSELTFCARLFQSVMNQMSESK